MANSAWSIGVDVLLQTTKSNIQQQINALAKDANIKIKVDTGDSASKVKDLSLSYQAANTIFQESVEVISSMIDQVYELDGALTDFKKVSDLQGKSLDNYVSKLTQMGNEVARTGKPLCRARMYRW